MTRLVGIPSRVLSVPGCRAATPPTVLADGTTRLGCASGGRLAVGPPDGYFNARRGVRKTEGLVRLLATLAKLLVNVYDATHVGLRLAVRRDAVVLLDGADAGVIGGQGIGGLFQAHAAAGQRLIRERIETAAQVVDGSAQVLYRIVGVVDAQGAGRAGHQLPQPHSADS